MTTRRARSGVVATDPSITRPRAKRALGAALGLVIAALVLAFCAGCQTVQPQPEDDCKDCPFTERPVPYWSPPEYQLAPDLPTLTAQEIADDPTTSDREFIAALIADRLLLMDDCLKMRHLYSAAVTASKTIPPDLSLLPTEDPAPPP